MFASKALALKSLSAVLLLIAPACTDLERSSKPPIVAPLPPGPAPGATNSVESGSTSNAASGSTILQQEKGGYVGRNP
jgi:hypothetical protein